MLTHGFYLGYLCGFLPIQSATASKVESSCWQKLPVLQRGQKDSSFTLHPYMSVRVFISSDPWLADENVQEKVTA